MSFQKFSEKAGKCCRESRTETDGLGRSQVSLCTVPELSNLTFSRSGEGRSHTWWQSGPCLFHSNLFFNNVVFISTPLYFAFPQQLRNTTFIFNSQPNYCASVVWQSTSSKLCQGSLREKCALALKETMASQLRPGEGRSLATMTNFCISGFLFYPETNNFSGISHVNVWFYSYKCTW